MANIKYFIAQSWLLLVCSFAFGLLIAVTDAAWAPKIAQNDAAKLSDRMKRLISQAQRFEKVEEKETTNADGRTADAGGAVTAIYKAVSQSGECVGWSFIAKGKGYSGPIELVVAVDGRFEKLAGYEILTQSETPGFGDRIRGDYFRSQFAGAAAGKFRLAKTGEPSVIDEQIVAITGATVSSRAVVNIVNNYLEGVREQLIRKELITNGK